MENIDHSAEDKNENLFYIITDFFQKNGESAKSIVEDYIIRQASNLLFEK